MLRRALHVLRSPIARHRATRLAAPVAAAVLLAGATTLPAQTPQDAALQVTATATVAPPSLTFTWPLDATATSYRVSRRAVGGTSWGAQTLIGGGGAATTWTDTNVTIGARYEYWFQKAGTPEAKGFLTAGIEANAIDDRGIVVLLVEATQAPLLGTRLDRLIEDLAGDGWTVLRHDVPANAPVPTVKSMIVADSVANPGRVRAVFLLGHVPVPYSGAINPDGHTDHYGAWPADAFYGEISGTWTDTGVNTTTASRAANHNVPFDGKYDQSTLPSDVDLAVGRVDLSNLPMFGVSETALLQRYLDKDHDYRHKVFAVAQRAIVDDNFGWFGGEAFAATAWRGFSAVVGPANVAAADYFTTLNAAAGGGYAWSYGCGSGSYLGAGGVGGTIDFVNGNPHCTFTLQFGSYFGDWDIQDNYLRAALGSGWTLCNAWAGRPHWSLHPMGLGGTIGECARLSQNDTTAGGYGTRFVHVALLGDPTLRQHVIAPPANVTVVDAWPVANVSWTPSADPVAGYHVYRAASRLGPFTRLTTTPVAGTSFTDPAPIAGESTWLVRALRLETTPGGTYWNLSQGAFATQRLPQQAAAHVAYGAGCYAISDSFWQHFATPAAASAALGGTSLALAPQNGGYLVQAGGATFVPPGGGATVLALGDDAAVAVPLPQPFPLPGGGSTTTLHVHANGIVSAAPLAMSAAASAAPAVAGLLGEAATAWYSWHDFDPTEAGSGAITVETVGGTVMVTWNAVESHPAAVVNASTQQLQFELATGVVRMVWPALTTVGTGQQTAPSEQWLVGWSPGGPSVDAGPLALATALPAFVGAANVPPLRLSASPAPVSTAAAGTLVTYAIDDVPAASPGVHVGLLVFSLTPDLAGTSLAAVGMPGCASWLGSFDATTFFGGSSPSLAVALAVPPGIPPGSLLFAQAVAMFPPGSLPNGQNALGALSSNGLASLVNDH